MNGRRHPRAAASMALRIAAAALVLQPAAGCADDDASGAGGTGGSGSTGAFPAGPGGGDPSGAGGGTSGCLPPTGDPLVHEGVVEADEVWSADAIHLVVDLVVRRGATVTVEPCTIVEMAGTLQVGSGATSESAEEGVLDVLGEPGREVTFRRGAGATGTWGRLASSGVGVLRLRHAHIEGGGAELDDVAVDNAVVFARNHFARPTEIHLEHVTIDGSATHGIVLDGDVRWTAGSTGVVVRGAQTPVVVSPGSWGDLPEGDYTGNESDQVLVTTGRLHRAITVRDRGVPYRVVNLRASDPDDLTVDEYDGEHGHLTFEPGVTVRFTTSLGVADGSSLVAQGTADEPITFTSDDDDRGWPGLRLGAGDHALEHVVVERAGGTGPVGCPLADGHAIAVTAQPAAPFITSSHFSAIEGHAIHRAWEGEVVDLAATNTFEGVEGCAQTVVGVTGFDCPDEAECP